MKRCMLVLFVLSVACYLPAVDFTVVYLDRSEVNMEAIKHVKKEISTQDLPLQMSYAAGFEALNDTQDPVVIMNTGIASGTDRRISTYLDAVPDRGRYILVNLYRMGKQVMFEQISSENSVLGVDEISAASYYDEAKGGLFSKKKESATDEMHRQWTSALFDLLVAR